MMKTRSNIVSEKPELPSASFGGVLGVLTFFLPHRAAESKVTATYSISINDKKEIGKVNLMVGILNDEDYLYEPVPVKIEPALPEIKPHSDFLNIMISSNCVRRVVFC